MGGHLSLTHIRNYSSDGKEAVWSGHVMLTDWFLIVHSVYLLCPIWCGIMNWLCIDQYCFPQSFPNHSSLSQWNCPFLSFPNLNSISSSNHQFSSQSSSQNYAIWLRALIFFMTVCLDTRVYLLQTSSCLSSNSIRASWLMYLQRCRARFCYSTPDRMMVLTGYSDPRWLGGARGKLDRGGSQRRYASRGLVRMGGMLSTGESCSVKAILEAGCTLLFSTQRRCYEDCIHFKLQSQSFSIGVAGQSSLMLFWGISSMSSSIDPREDYNFLRMIGEYPLIPREAFLFFPKDEEVHQLRNKKSYRIIFEGDVPYTPFQKEKLQELHEALRGEGRHGHLTFLSQPTLLRFLQATKFDLDDCARELKKYKKWEDSILPLRLRPEIEDILKKGLFYMTGRDINFRPIIVVNVARIIELDLKEETFYEVAGYFFTYVLENCMLEGQVETWITIVDLGKIGMFSLGGTIIDIISFLSRNFRCRLHYSYLINCPSSIKFLFGMAKKAMTEDQINKIHLQEEPELPRKAFANIFEETIEVKYGGTRENFRTFWPLKPDTQAPSAYQKSRLISVKDYGEMHFKGLLQKKVSAALLEESERLIKEEAGQREANERRQHQLARQLQEENQATMQTQASPMSMEIRDEDYIEDAPPEIKQIPKPIDFNGFFD